MRGVSNSTAVDPSWLDRGDNGWQLTAGTLVGLQSVPGLVVLYGGIVKTKWAINSALMALYAFAAVLVVWVLLAYKMSFGKQMLPFVGVPGPLMTLDNVLEQAKLPTVGLSANFPMATMAYFQFVFAAITVVITAGAFLGRMNFTAWMLFVPLWVVFSYSVGAFSIWGGGFLNQLGVIDYSGGYVIHISSGTAGLVGAAMIKPRLQVDRLDFEPTNPIMMLVGAGILWVGWNGFNGGDPFSASPDAGAAVLNTNISTSFSLLVWMILDRFWFGEVSVTGSVQGIITGLVAITPAAGVIDPWAAVVLGIISSIISWMSVNIWGNLRIFNRVDDTLRVFQTHAVAGFVGGMSAGLFATAGGCAAFGLANPGGAIEGHWKQVWVQLVGALFIMGWNLFMTPLILACIGCVVPLRYPEDKLLVGDDAIHGEGGYALNRPRRRAPANPRNATPPPPPVGGNSLEASD